MAPGGKAYHRDSGGQWGTSGLPQIYPNLKQANNRKETNMRIDYRDESTKIIAEKIGAWVREDGSLPYLAGKLGLTKRELNFRLCGIREWNWDEVLVVAYTIGCTPNELAGIK